MADAATLRPVGDWAGTIKAFLRDALHVSVDVCGRTGEEACRHAVILMAQSAQKLTKQAPALRKIKHDQYGRYIEQWWGDGQIRKWYDWRWSLPEGQGRPEVSFESLLDIRNRGLAKRSWMWSLQKLGTTSSRRPLPGVSRVYTLRTKHVVGYVKENKLHYLNKIMPAGWEQTVAMRAGNKIMAQARLKLERQWRAAMNQVDFGKLRNVRRKDPSVYFLKLNEAA